MCLDASTPDGAVRIPLYGRHDAIVAYTFVDAADAEWVNQWRWRVIAKSYAGRWLYDSSTKVVTCLYLHRELMGLTAGNTLQVDHVNREKLDNRRANLRATLHDGNVQNHPKHQGTLNRYRGVYYVGQIAGHRSKPWQAQIVCNGKKMLSRYFATEEEAAEAAREARLRLMPFATD